MKKQFTPEITLFFLATLVAQRSKYLLEGTRPKNCKSCDWSRLQRSFYFGQLPDNPAAIWNIFWFFRMASFELNPVLRHEVLWTSRSFLGGANLNLPLNFFLNGFGHFFLGKTLRFVIGTSSNWFGYILCFNAVIFKNVIRSKYRTFVANTHFGFHSRNVILPKYL